MKAQYDAHIAFDSDENDSDLYEIVIGGWGNSLSMVRRGKQGRNLGTGTVDRGSSPGQRGWTEVKILIEYQVSLQKIVFRLLTFYLQVSTESSGLPQKMSMASLKSKWGRLERQLPSCQGLIQTHSTYKQLDFLLSLMWQPISLEPPTKFNVTFFKDLYVH